MGSEKVTRRVHAKLKVGADGEQIKTIGDWRKEFEACRAITAPDPDKRWEREVKVRSEYRVALSGRLWEMGDRVHSFLVHLDRPHYEKYKDKTLREIADEFGTIEGLRVGF